MSIEKYTDQRKKLEIPHPHPKNTHPENRHDEKDQGSYLSKTTDENGRDEVIGKKQ